MRIQREGAQLQIRGTWSAGPGDDQARFLADLRALRDSAAIGFDELAARAHYPSDVLKEAENGPSLPGLPILRLTSAPATVTCWTGKNGGGASTLMCQTTRISRSGPPGRARPPWPAPAQASASRRPTSTTRIGSRPRSGVTMAVRSSPAEEPATPALGPGRERHQPGEPCSGWGRRLRYQRGQLGSQRGLGCRLPTAGVTAPTGTIRPLRHPRAVRCRVHQHPAAMPAANPPRPRSSPGCRRTSPKPGQPRESRQPVTI